MFLIFAVIVDQRLVLLVNVQTVRLSHNQDGVATVRHVETVMYPIQIQMDLVDVVMTHRVVKCVKRDTVICCVKIVPNILMVVMMLVVQKRKEEVENSFDVIVEGGLVIRATHAQAAVVFSFIPMTHYLDHVIPVKI